MKAGDPVQESAIDKNCDLLKKNGAIMKCAKDNLGKCFPEDDLEYLKLSGQQSFLMSMKCYTDDESEMIVIEDDIFFSWLEMDGLSMDKDANVCTVEAVDATNIAFQDCIADFADEGQEVLKDAVNVTHSKFLAKNFILKCFDNAENACFTEREMAFLRTEFESAFDVTMGIMFDMEDLNMMDEKIVTMKNDTDMDTDMDDNTKDVKKKNARLPNDKGTQEKNLPHPMVSEKKGQDPKNDGNTFGNILHFQAAILFVRTLF